MLAPYTNWVTENMYKVAERAYLDLIDSRRRSLLSEYGITHSIVRCASGRSKNARSLALNCRINPVGDLGSPGWTTDKRMSPSVFGTPTDLLVPSTTFTFNKHHNTSIMIGGFVVDATNTRRLYGNATELPIVMIEMPSVVHGGGCVVSFADAHIEYKKWEDKTTVDGAQKRMHTLVNDVDARWLQDRLIER